MYRIGIFGSENSHATGFAEVFNGGDPDFADIRVVAISGESPEDSKRISRDHGVQMIAASPADMLGHIDAAMVISRNGALHLGYSRVFIEAGLPCFVDKPIANDPEEALALVNLARAKSVPLTGGSSLKLMDDVLSLKALREQGGEDVKGGYLWAPLNMHNPYGDFYFYSAHLAEMCLEIFGMDPLSVDAFENRDNVAAVVHYPRYDVQLHFLNGVYYYGGVLQLNDGPRMLTINADGGAKLEGLRFARMLRTGEMPVSYREMIKNVFVLRAIEDSYMSGKRQSIGDM